MSESSIDLRSHRPSIDRDEVDALRRRLFEGSEPGPEIPGYEIESKLGEGSQFYFTIPLKRDDEEVTNE